MAGAAAKGLREWAKQVTAGYDGVSVTNLTTSWRDGMAFCAIIHHFRPDLINFGSLSKENIRENNKLAFDVAEQELGIPALLDPADMVALKVPDKLSIMTYLSQLYNFFSGPGLGGAGKVGVKRPPASLSPAAGIKKSKALDDDDNPFKAYLEQEPVLQETNKTEDHRRRRSPSPSNFSKSQLSSLKTSLKEDIEQFMPAEVVQRSDRSCSVCDKYVHIVEKVFVDGKMYHRNCFRCTICKVSLKAGAYKDGSAPGELICSRHGQTAEYRTPEPEKPKPEPEKKPEVEIKVEEESPSVAAKARARFFEEQAQQNAEKEASADPFAKRAAQKTKQEAEDKENKNMLPGILKNIADAKKKNQAKQAAEEAPPAKPPRSPYGLKNDNGNNNSPPTPKKDLNHEDVVMADVPELTPPPRRRKSDKTKKAKEGDSSKSPAPPSPKVEPEAPKSEAVPMKIDAAPPKVEVKDTKKPEKLKPQEAETTKPPRDVSPKPAERRAPKPRPRKAPEENGGDTTAPLETPKPKPRPRSAEILEEPVKSSNSYPEEKNPFDDEPSPTEAKQVQSQIPEKVAVPSPEKVPVKEEAKKAGPSPVKTKSEEKETRLAEPKPKETTSNQPKQEEIVVNQPKLEQTSINQTQTSEGNKVPSPKPEPAQVAPATEPPSAETNRPERANPFDTKPSERPNPFDTKPTERKLTRLKCSLNPFDEPSDEEEDDDSRSDSLNPFDISDDDLSARAVKGLPKHVQAPVEIPIHTNVDLDDHPPDDGRKPAAPVSEGPVEPQRRSAFPDVKRKKKRRAPAPPGGKPGLPPVMAVRPQPSLRGEKDADSAAPEKEGSPQKAQKKRRAPAPPVYRRQINSKNRVPQEEIDKELHELEKQLTELEHRGVKLEIMLRHGMASTIAGEDEDELLSDWFSLVNEKNKLVRRETELVYITRQQSLEDQQANVEYELRCLMQIPEEKKTMGEKSREAKLLNELLEIVSERNSIVDSLDEDRIREEEEDRDIEAMMADKGALSAHPPQPEDQVPPKEKKGRGLFGKKDKKDKEKDKVKRKPKVQI